MGFFRLFVILWALQGCGVSDGFQTGRKHEARGEFALALRAYEAFAAAYPTNPRTAEAMVRSGDIYASLERCLEARRSYEASLRAFPDLDPWAGLAQAGILSCPDYFPLGRDLHWVYGDSASLGRNMRLDWKIESSSSTLGAKARGALFAGKKRISSQSQVFERRDWAVWEKRGNAKVPVLKYPFTPGRTWTASGPLGVLIYTIESNDAEVATKAGRFKGCLKVKEANKSIPGSWKYDYYAPGVGRVKTTIAGPGFENPNTELLQFDKMAE